MQKTLLLTQKFHLQGLNEHIKNLKKKQKKLLRILIKLVKRQKKNYSSFVLQLKVVLFLKRKHALSLKKLVIHYSAFKTFHPTLVLVKKQSLHLLKQTSTFVKQLTVTRTLRKRKKRQLLLVLKDLSKLKMQHLHLEMQETLKLILQLVRLKQKNL